MEKLNNIELVLVLGGSGFIGTQLVQGLLEKGYQVRIADKRKSVKFPHLWVPCNICNVDDILNACQDVKIIYNLAAEHSDDVKPISLYYDVNVEGMRNLCKAASQININKIIFTSSVAVYGLNSNNVNETGVTTPFNDYGKSKLEAEKILQEWARSNLERSLTIVRPAVVFGVGNRGNVYNLIHQIVRGPFVMIGDGTNKKSMAYVENIAAFLIHVISFGAGVYLYNYVDKPDFDMNMLVNHIYKSINNSTKPVMRIPYNMGLIVGKLFDFLAKVTKKSFPISSIRVQKFTANSSFSCDKALAAGFIPPFKLEDALMKTIQAEFGSED